MAPKRVVAKAKGQGPVEIVSSRKVVKSNENMDNIFARPAFKATKPKARKSTSSFDRNMQKLLEVQKLSSPAAESSAMAASREPVDDMSGVQLSMLDDLLEHVKRIKKTMPRSEEQVIMLGTMHNVDNHTDAVLEVVNEIRDAVDLASARIFRVEEKADDIDDRTAIVEESVDDISDELQSVSRDVTNAADSVYETQAAVNKLQHSVKAASANIDSLLERMLVANEAAVDEHETVCTRMDAMDNKLAATDQKLDALIEMVRDANR